MQIQISYHVFDVMLYHLIILMNIKEITLDVDRILIVTHVG